MGKQRFTKSEITRAVAAARACDLVVTAVEIGPDGTIKICFPVDALEIISKGRAPKEWQ